MNPYILIKLHKRHADIRNWLHLCISLDSAPTLKLNDMNLSRNASLSINGSSITVGTSSITTTTTFSHSRFYRFSFIKSPNKHDLQIELHVCYMPSLGNACSNKLQLPTAFIVKNLLFLQMLHMLHDNDLHYPMKLHSAVSLKKPSAEIVPRRHHASIIVMTN